MRPCRIGTSSGTRVAAWLSSMPIGSRAAVGVNSACVASGVVARAALPAATRSARVMGSARSVRWVATFVTAVTLHPSRHRCRTNAYGRRLAGLAVIRQSRGMRGRTQDDGSTPKLSRHDYWGVQLEAPDARALAQFYADLLGWTMESSDDGVDAVISP